MKLRKLISMLLALAMLLAALAGCGSNPAGSASTSPSTDANSTGTEGGASGESETGEKKVLRVGMECAYAPFNWTQETDTVANGDTAVPIYGTNYYAYGYDVMMAQMIADYLGWDLEVHKVEWSSIGLGLDSGDYDCIIAGMGWTEEREVAYDFTSAYYIRETVVACKADSPFAGITGISQFAGKNVRATTQLSTVWVNDLTEIPDVVLAGDYETTSECFMAVQNGVADICVIDRPTTESALLTNDGLVILDLDSADTFSDAYTNVCIAVRDGDAELQGLIQGAMDSLGWDQAQMDEMMSLAVTLQPAAN